LCGLSERHWSHAGFGDRQLLRRRSGGSPAVHRWSSTAGVRPHAGAFERTLPAPPALVLDVGGGTGVYASALCTWGYAVDLIDPVAHHVERARELARAGDVSEVPTASLGDARALDAGDGQYDALLMLGPLYHLTERGDRDRAWSEACRVVVPGGVVIAGAISRFASLLDGLKRRILGDARFATVVAEDVRSGQHRNPAGPNEPAWFTTAYFHHPAGLRTEASNAGLVDIELFAVEGQAWIGEHIDDLQAQLASARAVESEPQLLSATSHILAVAHRPSD
jgi:SAM-dependent methyltransferase